MEISEYWQARYRLYLRLRSLWLAYDHYTPMQRALIDYYIGEYNIAIRHKTTKTKFIDDNP